MNRAERENMRWIYLTRILAVAGFAYLIGWKGWSAWWMAFAALLFF